MTIEKFKKKNGRESAIKEHGPYVKGDICKVCDRKFFIKDIV